MIEEYAKFKNGKLTCEVNWNDAVKPCELIKFVIDGKEAIIDRAHLYEMMMIFGDTDQQEQLIPTTTTSVKPVKRMLKVRAKQDIKKGDMISVVHTVYVPMLKEDKIRLTPMENLELEKKMTENQRAVEVAQKGGVAYKG